MQDKFIEVWDPIVRVFHWTLVVSFFIAYVTEDEVMWLHEYAGYLVLGLVLFRVIWGFIGTRHARFTDFVFPPREVLQYVKDLFSFRAKRYLGHNPAGGMMVIILLVMLALTSWTGIKAYEHENPQQASRSVSVISTAMADGKHDDDDERHGKGGERNELWEEVHEFFANFTLLLVFVHIAGVLGSSVLHRENLVRAMITGRKPVEK